MLRTLFQVWWMVNLKVIFMDASKSTIAPVIPVEILEAGLLDPKNMGMLGRRKMPDKFQY